VSERRNLEMHIHDRVMEGLQNRFFPVKLVTDRGDVLCRYYAAANADSAAIFVGGAGGGWDSPAHNIYQHWCEDLQSVGIAALRVRYRHANDLPECALDVLAGIRFLDEQDARRVGLVGHSFGGAVVAQAGAASPNVVTVITLSTQTYGIDAVAHFRPDMSLLAVHGKADRTLPHACSEQTYRLANVTDKHLILYERTGHGLDEAQTELRTDVFGWLKTHLGR
jgi:pimeloyl-ACP methyl ester carboxylesterase